ncbi:protein BTG1 [Nematostella vectensis]|nr:protein BTG1 [Nematostella vectensis]
MKNEVSSAVNFVVSNLTNTSLSSEQVGQFKENLEQLITERFQDHWHPNKPLKGNAYRCLNVDTTAIDPLLVKASLASGFSPLKLQEVFPDGLALWIDPEDVCCRVGRIPIRTIYGHRSSPTFTPPPRRHQPFTPINFNTSPYHCTVTYPANNRTYNPKYFQNKENFNRYHWVNREANFMTAQVY